MKCPFHPCSGPAPCPLSGPAPGRRSWCHLALQSAAPAHASWPGRGRLHLHWSGTAAAAAAVALHCFAIFVVTWVASFRQLNNKMDMVALDRTSGREERKRLTSTRALYRSTHTTQSKASAEVWPTAQALARHPCHPLSNISNNIPVKIIIRNRHPPRQEILICIFTLL